MIKVIKKLMVIGLVVFTIVNVPLVFGGEVLSKVRVFYRPDGGVSILSATRSSCHSEDTEDQCLERAAQDSPTTLGWPYDDMYRDQLPQDKSERDKWRGSKGGGVWVDAALVTKSEKIKELEEKINEELDKDNPDLQRTAKLERLMEKAKDMPNAVLSAEDLAQLEEKKKSLLAVAVEAVGNFLQGIFEGLKDGILALRNIIIGTPEAPSGITIYDTVTKQPYCSIVANGQGVNLLGVCSSELIQSYLNSSTGSPQVPPTPSPESAPTVILSEPSGASPEQGEGAVPSEGSQPTGDSSAPPQNDTGVAEPPPEPAPSESTPSEPAPTET